MKILIAEDDELLQMLDSELMDIWGYEFDMASNGKEAVEQAQKNEGKYDLCLMDIDMPLMNGYEATKIIRQKVKYFPIMAVTGNLSIGEKYWEAGMDDFLEKPYDHDKLFNKINELTVKIFKLEFKDNDILIKKEIPMTPEELRELSELKKKGLTKLKLVGTGYTFVVHRNIQNKISHDLIGEGKELSEFIDRSEKEPGRCHLYKMNLHVTKDIFTPDELEDAIKNEDQIALKFANSTDQKLPE